MELHRQWTGSQASAVPWLINTRPQLGLRKTAKNAKVAYELRVPSKTGRVTEYTVDSAMRSTPGLLASPARVGTINCVRLAEHHELFNADKSEILSIRSQRAAASLQESDPVIHPISMNGVRVPACQKHKHLGVVINNSLSWSDHIDDVFTKCARHVGILNSLRKKLSKRCLTRIYKGYIRPRLEYACAVWSGGNTSKLLKLQQKFCRQHQVQLPNLSNRFKFHTLTLFYKIRNGLAPTYLSEILPGTLALSSGRNLRRHVYPFPRINKSSTMQSFLPRATVFWNELPASIQSSSSLHSFKAKLRDLLKI